ncbi:MAG: heparinase II/III family protein, partial [Oscillospiraceae bacterium]|nr:heparinase II/III family protein [Oscillospiraceae bacterium]
KVLVTLTLDGYSAHTEAEITVTDSTPIKSASLFAPETVGYLREAELTLTGEMESGYGVDFSQAQIHWFVESTPPGGVSITENNRLYGDIFEAAAEIYAEITLNGNTVTTNKVNVSVGESSLHDVILKFTSLPITKISEVTLGEYGWELNTELSHSSASNISAERFCTYFNTNAADADLVFDIDIPYAGVYTPIISCTSQEYAPKLAYVYVDGIFAGEYEAYMNNSAESCRSFFLTKGVHTLTLRPIEKGIGYKFPLQLIRFAARQELPTVDKILTGKDAYAISVGESVNLGAYINMTDGFEYAWQTKRDGSKDPYASVAYAIDDSAVAGVSADGTITAKAEGTAKVTVTVSLKDSETESGTVKKTTKEIAVTVVPEGAATADNTLASVEIEAPFYAMNPEAEGAQLTAVGKNAAGEKLDMTSAEIVWSIEENEAMTVSDSGYITPLDIGEANVTATVALGNITLSGQHFFSVREGKVGRTYYPNDAAEIAKENASKYTWAKSTVQSAIDAADRYVGMEDFLWELVPAEGIPRAETIGYRSDPEAYICRYCGVNLAQKYSLFAWIANPFTRKWKVQCPDCKRLFPSNDFESFYELGRDEHGVFDVTRAREKHHNMLTHGDKDAVCDCPYIPTTEKSDVWYEFYGYGNPEGYLYNELYSELRDPSKTETYNIDPYKKVEVDGARWGVDDGFGYDTGRTYPAGTSEIHTYIAYYMHYGVWLAQGANNAGIVQVALEKLSAAYLYTGDEKYGRVGAILLDRIADIYPGYNLRLYPSGFLNSDGGSKGGKIVGRIWEANVFSRILPMAYDAFWPMYDDPYVVSFLDEKAKTYKLEHKLDENGNVTPETLRKNCEDGICREGYKAALDTSSQGNFGMHQAGVALAAVVLDSHPETDEMMEWIYKYEETNNSTYNNGGDVGNTLLAEVSRDGIGSEGAAGYNRGWITRLVSVADAASSYDETEMVNLYEHPKYVSMITAWLPYTLVRRGVPSIGDSGALADYARMPDNDQVLMNGFKNVKEVNTEQAIKIAQLMWFLRDGNLDNIHYDILTKDPESIQTEIREVIDTYGEYDFDKSSMLTGHGFGVLRAGTLHSSVGQNVLVDTQRDFWMYFGGALSHKHADGLNLGIEAYGIDLSGDIGYPETTGHDANRSQWVNKTISHNCVVVNESSIRSGKAALKPLHFDAKDTRVKVMDVDGGNSSYADTDEYRRTVVMVDYDDEISYAIDFFKVLGGDDHLYSFHANSIEDPEVSDNLKFIAQNGGSYAGEDVTFGNDPWTDTSNAHSPLQFPDGYTWLDDIKRADNPGVNEFWLDYKIKDYRKNSRNDNMDIHMRMTAVNDWAPDEVTLANGISTRSGGELEIINHMEYMLVRRKGEMLNTLFTTVIEPYNKERYIKSIKRVDIEPTGDVMPGKTDAANAVRVELVDGRVDYVVYAQNNDVTYRITDADTGYTFDFKGFVGVWTVAGENENIYSYIHDGEMMGTETEKVETRGAAIEGKILNFERELSFENWRDVEFDREITQSEADTLCDRLLNVEFKGHGNAAYIIESVDMSDATHGRINFGNVSLINGFVDVKDESKGYTYDVAVGKSFEIPMSYEENNEPVFDEISDSYTTSAGSTVTVKLNATADDNGPVTYSARTLPRGASFNAETATFSWKPTGSQVGDSLVAIDAVDEFGRIATQYFTVTVYGS